MNNTLRPTIAAILVTVSTTVSLRAQDVVLSEVRADASERWVEIHNRGATAADIGTWSLFYATKTPSMPRNYWWAFPIGTTLPPDSYIRVFWHQNQPTLVLPGEFYTGTSPYGYLFGLGGEQLHGAAGAFALVDSQQNALMNSPSRYVDWVSWGDDGYQREDLAVQNGTWTAGVHTPAIPTGQSLARNLAAIGAVTTHEQQWFLDATPTPMTGNVAGMSVVHYGQSCAVPGHHLMGSPTLRPASLPLLGNSNFGYIVDNTTGFFGESMLFVFSAHRAPIGQPSLLPLFPGSTCIEAIDTGSVIASLIVSTQVVETIIPMSLANLPPALAGVELHTQAMIFDWLPNAYPPFQGVTNAVEIVVGQ